MLEQKRELYVALGFDSAEEAEAYFKQLTERPYTAFSVLGVK